MIKRFSDMDDEEFKKCLLDGMCNAVEVVEEYYSDSKYDPSIPNLRVRHGGGCLTYVGKCPIGFKPNLADKLIFRKIIEKVFTNIRSETNTPRSNELGIGLQILSRYYWPYYGWCDEMELEKNRRPK